ncbi:Eukaryotic translation initiation factor 4B [Vanrija albida]|uniref:Eukaryotic translation initiation factor 4B n=1 Tax=Vanrija albida TaxID=181172 RepID=A0ABR3QFS5_9TREE
MAPKKQKAQKMNLADFFAETNTAHRTDTGPRRGEPGYLDSMPDRSARPAFGGGPVRDEVPVPDVPPFTAFVGNLTFETDEEELRAFFQAQDPKSVRLVKDAEGKLKGFGYVEFNTRDGLVSALAVSGTSLGGRTVRVNVAEAPSTAGRRDFAPSAADEASQWRRATPLVQRQPEPPRRTFSGASDGADRDWSAARGAKFTPSRESSGYGRPRDGPPHEGREPRELTPSAADDADQWRSNKAFVPPPAPQVGGARGPREPRDAPPHRPAGPADTESTWSRGTRSPAQRAEPAEPQRPRLNLQARSAAAGTAAETASSSSKASPFGAAKPVDSAAREAEAAAHAEERRKEKAAAGAKAKEEAEKAKAAQAAKRDAERAAQPKRVHPSRLPPKEAKEAAAADADGFEQVAAPRAQRESAPAAAAAPAKPATKATAGFSFAAAASALGSDEVDDVADKVADVSV